MELIEVSLKVPKAEAARMQQIAEASGVTFDAFVSASLELRCEQHADRETLIDELLVRARKYC